MEEKKNTSSWVEHPAVKAFFRSFGEAVAGKALARVEAIVYGFFKRLVILFLSFLLLFVGIIFLLWGLGSLLNDLLGSSWVGSLVVGGVLVALATIGILSRHR